MDFSRRRFNHEVVNPWKNFIYFMVLFGLFYEIPNTEENTVQLSSTAEKIFNRIDVTVKPLSKLRYEIQFLR